MKKLTVVLIALMSLCTCAFAAETSMPASSDVPTPNARTLMDDLYSNQVRFDKNYKDRSLPVTGYVGEVEDRGDFYALKLFGDADTRAETQRYILCRIDKSQENALLTLNRGNVITVTGFYRGRQEGTDGFFVLQDTSLPSNEKPAPIAENISDDVLLAVVPTAANVNIRAEPNPQSKILGHAAEGHPLLVDPLPLRDEKSNTGWYRIVYLVSTYDRTIIDPTKIPEYGNKKPYISAEFVRQETMGTELLKELEWFRAGKPVSVKVGDDLGGYFKDHLSEADRLSFTSSFDLYAEPSRKAQRITTLPPGKQIIVSNNLLYTDTDDVDWSAVVDGDTKKLLGWTEIEHFHKAPKKYLEP